MPINDNYNLLGKVDKTIKVPKATFRNYCMATDNTKKYSYFFIIHNEVLYLHFVR